MIRLEQEKNNGDNDGQKKGKKHEVAKNREQ